MPISKYTGLVIAGFFGTAFAAYYTYRENQRAERRQVAQWSSRKKLDFFCNASNVLLQLPLNQANQIERNSYDVLVRGNWRLQLTAGIENYLFPIRASAYNATSVKSLLQAIRNNGIREDYDQLQPDIKSEFGDYPAGYLRYWTIKFPDLLMHVYDVMRVYRADPSMRRFYREM